MGILELPDLQFTSDCLLPVLHEAVIICLDSLTKMRKIFSGKLCQCGIICPIKLCATMKYLLLCFPHCLTIFTS